jgi:hypothetical protein
MRIRCIPSGHSFDRRLERPETFLLHAREQFRAEPAEACRLMRNHAEARLGDGRSDGFHVERYHGAYVDDLRVDPGSSYHGLCDVYQRTVGEEGHRVAGAHNLRTPDRHRVIARRNLALRMDAPGNGGLVRILVERSVVETFGLKKMTGSSSSIAAISNPFASYGFDGITTLMPQIWANSASGLCE